jgi:hypothetical protein
MTKRLGPSGPYPKPNHIIGMCDHLDASAPATFTVLADGLVAVAWSSAVKCAACESEARSRSGSASPAHRGLFVPEMYPASAEPQPLVRSGNLNDTDKPMFDTRMPGFVEDDGTDTEGSRPLARSDALSGKRERIA